jgi:polar amino acid transport system substrate-binding protein
MHWIRAAIALALIALPLAGGADGPALRVGTAADYAPLSFEEQGEIRGVELEFARRLAADLGRAPQIVKLPFAGLIPALRDGRIDIIMSGMSITPERARLVRFCEPYLKVGQMALIRRAEFSERSAKDAIRSPSARIGFVVHTTGERFARAELSGAKLVSEPSVEAGVADLRAGKIDYFVHDAPTIWRVVGGFSSDEHQLIGLYTPLTDEQLAWAVRSDDSALAARAAASLENWKREGFVEQVLDHWIPVRKISR